MKKVFEQFKPYDYIIVFCCIVFSFFPLITFAVSSGEGDKIAIIKLNGKEIERFNIDEIKHFEKRYDLDNGKYNIIEIKDGRIRNREDNSPDQIAVRTGWIERPGQIAICIPHDFIIEIITEGAEKDANYPIY